MHIDSPLQVKFAGLGSYVPENRLTNEDLERMVETSDRWITQRTGIKERRILDEDQATSDLAAAAGRQALENADLAPEELDMILVATCTPDYQFPATACLVQTELGAENAMACDLEAACSGFLYATAQAANAIGTGAADHALVIGAESLSRFTDYDDRGSCILFGDGAGAAVLSRSDDDSQVLCAELGADGSHPEILWVPAGGAREPASHETVDEKKHYMRLKGREVFRWAVNKLTELMLRIPEQTGIPLDDVDIIVPHQSNVRIIRSACERAGIAEEKAYMNIDRYGNTSAASVPLALHEAAERGEIEPGDLLLMLVFGGGVTWGSMLCRY
jgi:3-oxoacyl-[acyl-carrier-protein] synthase-3